MPHRPFNHKLRKFRISLRESRKLICMILNDGTLEQCGVEDNCLLVQVVDRASRPVQAGERHV